ncbi:MAG: glycerophosphodiester phosphodiesterase family protein [Candidatus Heimdallarchaeota archaeon]|nr:glycerophosphodiester phosphodiesterase family protein [Candidatus Heimdallarchaeota archaeon]MDH5645128.1 glycerophosphodiester phosphodiesterase family protein [Candidatus Heimdallarchaeota archaeon]
MRLLPNTVEGLLWGLENFDGVEFDIRLTMDSKLVIHHDPILTDGTVIANNSLVEIKERRIPSLNDFLSNVKVKELLEIGRTLWIELKPNCQGKKPVFQQIADAFRKALEEDLQKNNINFNSIRLISFNKDILDSFVDKFACYPILPFVNECNPSFVTLKALPRVLAKSLTWHINEAVNRKFQGVTYARQYMMGLFAIRHPKYKKVVELSKTTGIELGTNLGTPDLEAEYSYLHRFTDKTHVYPRHAKSGEGKIIAHRGTGTKGIELPDKTVE